MEHLISKLLFNPHKNQPQNPHNRKQQLILTFGRPCHIRIFHSQNKRRIAVGIIQLSLFGNQPIVQCRSRSAHVQRPRRRRREAHPRRLVGRVLAFEGKDARQFGHDGVVFQLLHTAGRYPGTVTNVAVQILFALQLLHERDTGFARSGFARATEAASGDGFAAATAASSCECSTTGWDKGLC